MTTNKIHDYKAPALKTIEVMLSARVLYVSGGIPSSTETDQEEDLY